VGGYDPLIDGLAVLSDVVNTDGALVLNDEDSFVKLDGKVLLIVYVC
jgi:hypothetical protein